MLYCPYMEDVRAAWQKIIAQNLNEIKPGNCEAIEAEKINMEIPPNPSMGDIAFPLFTFAKLFKKAPAKLAEELCARLLQTGEVKKLGTPQTAGPYLNVFL